MGRPKGSKKVLDTLDQLAADGNANPRRIIALLLWQDRHRNPEMSRQITENDLKGFTDCVNYLETETDVVILRPQGHPGTAGVPAVGKRRAVPARPAEGPRAWVTVNLVRRGTMDSVKPIENNEDDARLRDQAEDVRRWRDKAAGIARELISGAASGSYSTSVMQEAAQALNVLARA